MDVIFERVAALDVHKAQVTACVRVPGTAGREQQLTESSTTEPLPGLDFGFRPALVLRNLSAEGLV
jgi:hypothetical protein